MRPLNVFFAIGMTALAAAAQAQESLCDPCLDVPADYQALKPLATDWPHPSSPIYVPSTRFNMGATRPVDMRRMLELRQWLDRLPSIASLPGLTPAVVLPDRSVPPTAEPAAVEVTTSPEPAPAPSSATPPTDSAP